METIECVHSVKAMLVGHADDVDILVIDNGSTPENLAILEAALPQSINLQKERVNLGFAGGHNLAIRQAISQNYQYIWLLNNDCVVYPDTLVELISEIEVYPNCAACSSVIVPRGRPDLVDFCGAVEDWTRLDSIRCPSLEDAPEFLQRHAANLWAVGTAILFRVAALQRIGALDERYFAYYEDNDIGARIIEHGYTTRVALRSRVEHACFDGDMYARKPYFFYLMSRNCLLYMLEHTPIPYRRLIRLRMLYRALYFAEKLYAMGFPEKGDACFLGIADGLANRFGPPHLERPVPY
jgi:GT2 family glycosyltransferase